MQRYLREIRPTLALALPIIVGQVSQMLMGVLDSVMIGRVGTVPLAASSFGGNVFSVFYVVGIGLLVPVSIFAARSRGSGQLTEGADYLRHGLALALAFGVIETLVMVALSTQLDKFGQPPEVLALVKPFFLLIAASLVPVFVYLVLRQFAEAMGHPWMPLVIVLVSVGVNAVLNWVFIYGHLGAPALGLTGAGLSTLIARVLAAMAIFVWLRRDPAMRAAWPVRWFGNYSRERFRSMLSVGLPAGGMLLFESTAFTFSTVMIGWLGAASLAAHQIALTCVNLTFMVPLGLSMATGMGVSRATGAGELARRRPIAFSSIGLGMLVMGAFGLTFFFAGGMIANWFVDEPAVVSLAARLLVVAALFQMFDGVQVIGAASLRGIADVKVPALITFAAYWMVALPLGYFFGIRAGFGATGVWTGLAIGLAFAAVFLARRFARQTRSSG